jgi:hypothetical protein
MPSRSLLAALICCSSCVTYEFSPVEPLAASQVTIPFKVGVRSDKPDLFLVVDKSGSMDFGVEKAGCNCPEGMCPPGCPTRWTELQSAMGGFLINQGTVAHLGMVPFPNEEVGQCSGAQLSDIRSRGVELDTSSDLDLAAMQQSADAIKARLDRIKPYGGTPSAASLTSLLGYDRLTKDTAHPRYALLLTDGLPNCNSANDPQTTTCTCTANKPTPTAACGPAGLNQCLDDTGTAEAIARLREANVKTIILGFGADTKSGLGPQTLELLGKTGGFERECHADSDCGAGDSCSVHTTSPCGKAITACARHFFQAGNAVELGAALEAIRNGIGCTDPCFYALGSRPSNPKLLAVRMDDRSIPRDQPDTWVYDEVKNEVTFQGASCSKLTSSTVSAPVKLEFRVLQTL